MDARAVDDIATSSARDEVRKRLLRTEHGARQIYVEDSTIGFDIERLARRLPLEAGIVDKAIKPRPARQDRLKHLRYFGLDTDIGLNREMVPMAVPPLGRRSLHACESFFSARRRTDEVDSDVCAFLSQPNGYRSPNALRGSGHKRVLPDQTGCKS